VCDRILVFSDGRLRAEMGRGQSEQAVLEAVNGGKVAAR
jgi:ABC-type sugar transport system ATPase subunit